MVDGDTLRIGDARIRLFGIDAPERDQTCSRSGIRWPCGTAAMQRLSGLVAGKTVRCLATGIDGYGRTVARCDTIGVDLNKAMVESGYAVAFQAYSTDYVSAQASAKAAKRGLWAGTFEQPSDFRARERSTGTATARASAQRVRQGAPRPSTNCVIKGNHSRRGDWIYHLPGMPFYEQTRAEAMFCSEADAQAAGYRRARRSGDPR